MGYRGEILILIMEIGVEIIESDIDSLLIYLCFQQVTK